MVNWPDVQLQVQVSSSCNMILCNRILPIEHFSQTDNWPILVTALVVIQFLGLDATTVPESHKKTWGWKLTVAFRFGSAFLPSASTPLGISGCNFYENFSVSCSKKLQPGNSFRDRQYTIQQGVFEYLYIVPTSNCEGGPRLLVRRCDRSWRCGETTSAPGEVVEIKKRVSFVFRHWALWQKSLSLCVTPDSNWATWLTGEQCVCFRAVAQDVKSIGSGYRIVPDNRIEPSIRRKSAEVHRRQTGAKRHVHASDVFICKQHQNPDKLSIR